MSNALDLLRKSGGTCAGQVAERRNQLNSKGKPTSPMSVYALQHAEDLHATDDMQGMR
jgi:hypothetical protein